MCVFCLVPSSGTYFSVIELCLNFYVGGFLSAGCRIIPLFVSGVGILMGEFCTGTCAGFLVRETGACPLVGGARSCLSAGHGCVKDCV